MAGPVAHNPLHSAARESMTIAREAKSPMLERVAVFAMIGSAVTGMALGTLHALHLIRKDLRDDRRERERDRPQDRRTEAAPPESSHSGGPAAAAASHPDHDRDAGDRRWTRREEHAAHVQARYR